MTIIIPVAHGVLMDIPADDHGPLYEEYSPNFSTWVATISRTDDPRKPDRLFWEHIDRRREPGYYRLPVNLCIGTALEFGVNARGWSVKRNPLARRRLYAVVSRITLDEDRSGLLHLEIVDGTPLRCLRRAQTVGMAIQPQIRAFIDGVKTGNLFDLIPLYDWLVEQQDPRAEILRGEILEVVGQLFPEAMDTTSNGQAPPKKTSLDGKPPCS